MTRELQLGLIGLGEVGQVLASDLLLKQGVKLCAWDRLFPLEKSEPQRAAAALPLLATAGSMAQAVRDRALVISAVTAGECRAAALEAAQALTPGTYYLDLNSVSPGTRTEAARMIEAVGGRYIEAAVMSPIAPQRSASPVWLGGPHAQEFLPLAQSLGFTGAAVYSGTIGAASAAKMCRSVVIKGLESLMLESLLSARHHGVEVAVLDSLRSLFSADNASATPRYMISRALVHGRRRAEEMGEAARTVAEAGISSRMSSACAEWQAWASHHPEAASTPDIVVMLDALLAARGSGS